MNETPTPKEARAQKIGRWGNEGLGEEVNSAPKPLQEGKTPLPTALTDSLQASDLVRGQKILPQI